MALCLLISGGSFAQVGIGTTTPNSSAVLDLSSTSKGLLIPRMTSSQRTSISSPATGLIVFDTDSGYVFYYNSSWKGLKIISQASYSGTNGVSISGSSVKLGGNLSSATTIGTSSSNTLKLTGVQSGASTDSLVVMNNGVVKKINPYTGSNGVTISSNGVKLGGNLSSATTIGTSSGNTLKLTGVQAGSTSDSIMVLSGGVVKKVAQSSVSSQWTTSSTAIYNNNSGNVGIGTSSPISKLHVDPAGSGNIILGTDIYTGGYTSVNIGISSQSGGYPYIQGISKSGSVYGTLALNPYGGNVTMGGLTSTSYPLDVKGLSDADSFGIGGNTIINTKGTHNTFIGQSAGTANTSSNNTFNGYQAGNLTTSGGNNTAVGFQAASTNSTGTKNTIIGSTADVASSALTNATAIGYAAIVGQSNSIVLGATGTNQPNVGIGTTTPASTALLDLSSTTKGILIPRMTSSQRTSISSPATGLIVFDTDSGYVFYYNSSWKGLKTVSQASYSGTNGVSISGSSVKLGGNLSSATTIGTSSTNTLKLTGVQSGTTSDSLMVLSSGVVKKIAVSTAAPTYTASNGVNMSSNNVALGGNLSSATTIGTTSSNTLKLTGVQSGASTDSLVVMNNGVLKKMNPYTGSNGVTISGNGVKLGGNLSAATTIGTSSTNTLKLTGVQAGTTSDSLMLLSSGVVKKIAVSTAVPTYTAGNGVNMSSNNVALGGNLSSATTIGTSSTNTLKLTGVQSGTTSDSLMVLSSGVVKKIAVSTAVPTYTGNNGVTVSGSNVSLGGNLSAATTIGTSSSNTLKLTGVQSGSSTDSLVVMNNGLVKKMNPYTGSNGVTISGNGVKLGGNLSAATTIGTSSTNTLKLTGVQSGTTSDSLMVLSSGVIKKIAVSTAAPTYTGSNGVTVSGSNVTLGGNLSSATTIGTSSTNTLKLTGVQSGASTDSLVVMNNGLVKKMNPYTGSNGVTISGNGVKLGGNLSSATTIGTSSTNTLKLTGVQSGSTSDSLMVLSSGVVKKVSQSSISSPWTHSGSNTTLTNSGDNVGVGKTPSYDLDVNGLTNSDSFGIAGFTVLKLKGTHNVFVGKNTAPGNSGSDNTMLGFQAGYKNTYGDENVFIGSTAGVSNTAGNDNIFLGYAAGYSNGTGSSNFFSGSYSGYSNTSGSSNIFSGYGAGYSNTTGSYNVFSGSSAGINNTTGSANTFTGVEAGDNNSTGSDNVFTGVDAGVSNTTGNFNVFTGTATGGINTTGAYNTFTGSKSGFSNSTGHDNIFMGYLTGGTNTTGNNNVVIGDSADVGSSGLNNAIAIGYKAVVNSSNSMVFGNSSVTGWGFGAATPSSTKVFIVGTTSGNGNGAYLTAGGTWTNASDVNLKENFTTLDAADILEKISKLNITRWMYKGTEAEYHIGPMAQDFHAAFNVGVNDKSISTIDPAGVALIGVQELKKRNDELQKTNDALVQKNVELENKLNGVEELVKQVRDAQIACCRQLGNLEQAAVLDVPVLGQNTPNPFSENTVISYYLPASSASASIIITDMSGKALQSFKLTQNGNGQILVGGNALASGTYNYTLIVNGTQVDTKRMIITK